MESLKIEFQSPVRLRVVVIATLIAIAFNGVMWALGTAFGIWTAQSLHPSSQLLAFWIWNYFSWAVGTFAGAFLAASIVRSSTVREGILNGMAVWAAYYVFRYLVFLSGLVKIQPAFQLTPTQLTWLILIGQVAVFVMGLVGGVWGIHPEKAAPEEKKETTGIGLRRPEPGFGT